MAKKKVRKHINCIFCLYKTSTNQILYHHLRSHIQEKPFFCKVCDAEFSQEAHLKTTHMLIHTGQKPFKCSECPKRFGQRANLSIHFKLIHTDARPFSCEWCGKSFKIRGHLKAHDRTVHKGHRPHRCEFCGKGFSQMQALKGHVIAQHKTEEDRPHKCEHCDKSFIYANQLTLHLRGHSGDKPYKCEFCGDAFTTNGNLRAHVKIHKKEAVYKDAASGTTFEANWRGLDNTRKNLGSPLKQFTLIEDGATLSKILSNPRPEPEFLGKEYVRGIKTEDNQLLKCDHPGCGAVFTAQTSLTSHVIKHLNKNIKCSFCGLTFKKKEDREDHTAEFHDPDADPLKCKKCGKVTRNKQALWRHVRETHRKGPTPICPHCGVVFNRRDNLNEHIKYKHPKVGEEKVFRCEICGKVYNYKPALRKHIQLMHRGEVDKIYRCVICGSTTPHKVAYWRHIMQHANPKYFPCPICNTTFRSSSHLKRHYASYAHKRMARKRKNFPQMKNLDVKPEMKPKISTKPLSKEELISLCEKVPVTLLLRRIDSWMPKQRNFTFNSTADDKAMEESSEKPEYLLKCTYCHQDDFSSLASVKHHEELCLKKKRSQKRNICSICNKEFGKPNLLQTHMRTRHSQERGFQCSYCDSKFKTTTTKIQHEKAVHFGIRALLSVKDKYKCTFDPSSCQKKYSRPEHLRKHLKSVHWGIRYPCHKCDRKFKCIGNRRKHLREDHSENPTLLLCHPCKRAFKSKNALVGHFKTKRHQRKSRELCLQFGGKEEMTNILSGKIGAQPGGRCNGGEVQNLVDSVREEKKPEICGGGAKHEVM